MSDNNVFGIKTGRPLFNDTVRQQLEHSVDTLAQGNAKQCVDRFEETLCKIIVEHALNLGKALGKRVGDAIGGKK